MPQGYFIIESFRLLFHIRSVEGDGEICLETPPINRIHIVSRALVESGIHLGGGINFDLRLDLVVADAPLVDVHVEVLVDLGTVFVPGDVGPGITLGHAQEGDLVAQHVLKIEVRGLQDFGAL